MQSNECEVHGQASQQPGDLLMACGLRERVMKLSPTQHFTNL